MNTYLKWCSPHICKLIYDIDKRVLIMECVNNLDDCVPDTRVTFRGIKSYSEETIDDEYDDNCMDGVIGMNWLRDRLFCIRTDKKEIIIEIENDPVTSKIA